ncbi:hypothetical protein CEXT_271441 [Caerostris extrusa]|uniref:Uncharacterized protein n=1 Tax=Caerostris extrusa TaxID=172846 RepID=A0AAV4U1W6_CAEEX|nr:hypothetical protein CEXT_271441 [Caerostris extrusa]
MLNARHVLFHEDVSSFLPRRAIDFVSDTQSAFNFCQSPSRLFHFFTAPYTMLQLKAWSFWREYPTRMRYTCFQKHFLIARKRNCFLRCNLLTHTYMRWLLDIIDGTIFEQYSAISILFCIMSLDLSATNYNNT